MPKKRIKSSRKKDHSLQITFVIVGSFLVLVTLSAFLMSKSSQAATFCANSVSCIGDLSGKPQPETEGVFMGQKVQAPEVPDTPSYEIAQAQNVLGTSTGEEKHIYVDLGHQVLYAYEGNNMFMNVPISSGKWHPTPTGDFHIWVWLRATRMTGGDKSKGTFYDLPNVPYTMYFYNDQIPKSDGYSLHGAYWHNNFGHPMSHGCVNMRVTDAQKLFYWSNSAINGWATYPTADDPGPTITIYGNAPASETSFID